MFKDEKYKAETGRFSGVKGELVHCRRGILFYYNYLILKTKRECGG